MCVIIMAQRALNKLTALQVKKVKLDQEKIIKLSDGGNLYLRVDPNGSKYWIFNYTRPFTGKKMTYHSEHVLKLL